MPSNHISNEPYHKWLGEEGARKRKAMASLNNRNTGVDLTLDSDKIRLNMNTELLILVLKYHAGQMRVGNREDGRGDPQIEHLLRVFTRLLQPCDHYPKSLRLVRQNATPIMLDVALAHDMLEDTEVTEKELAEVLNEYALEAVKALTRTDDQTYFDYIREQVLSNPVASVVKLADLEDNYETAIPSLQERYSEAKGIILDHWNNVVFPDPAEEDYPGEEPGAEKQEEEEKTAIVLPD